MTVIQLAKPADAEAIAAFANGSFTHTFGHIYDPADLATFLADWNPPERVRALWQMLTATYSDSAEARRMGKRLRHLLIKLWAPYVQQRMGLDERRARALSWMLNMAFWGAHQLVEEGELNRTAALELFTGLLLSLQDRPAAAQRAAPKTRSKGATP